MECSDATLLWSYGGLNISLLRPHELTATQVACWREIQNQAKSLQSGLFCAELVQMVDRHRAGLEVALIENRNRCVGFFPFYRDRWNFARPFAGPLTDFQGVVAALDEPLDIRELLRSCNLNGWSFDHLLAEQQAFRPYHVIQGESPYMDLSRGFEAYRTNRRNARSDELKEALRKSRKIQRELGALRFEPYVQKEAALNQLLKWKAEQLHRTKAKNSLSSAWISSLMREVITTRTPEFAGMLSAIYVGDQLAAATLGVRSRNVLHGWVTAYDRKFAKYSPGLILLTQLGQAAENLGVHRIDMGKGSEPYKRSFGSGGTPLAEGVVDLGFVGSLVRTNLLRAKQWIKSSRLAAPADSVRKAFR